MEKRLDSALNQLASAIADFDGFFAKAASGLRRE
jgi:hypothetical protein